MSSTDQNDEAAEPSTEIALREEVEEMRAELEQLKTTARTPAPRPPRAIDEWVLIVKDYNLLAQSLSKTAFVPKGFQGKPDQITAVMMYGREIGLPPMTTLQNAYEVHGRVGMYAEQLRAMILDAGHDFTIDEMTSDRCTLSGQRKGRERWETFTYTMDQAKSAGLYAQNEQYRKRPVEMLFARATGIMAHAMFPDVIRGMSAVEELEDEGAAAAEAPAVTGEPARKATATVGRKRATKAIGGPVESQAPRAEPDPREVIPAEPGIPPLPGEAEAPAKVTDEPRRMNVNEALGDVPSTVAGSAGPTPGEGSTDDVPPAEPGVPMTVPDAFLPEDRTELRDRVDAGEFEERHCADFDNPHEPHTWIGEDANGQTTYACGGVVQAAESAPVADKPKPMHTAQTKALQAWFKGLGFTDEPDDREQRLRVAAAIVGHDVDTFRAGTVNDNTLTYDEAQRVLTILAPCRSREDVIELMVKISQEETP